MAEDKKKSWFARHKILTVILAFVAIGVIASAAGGGSESNNSSSSDGSGVTKTEDKKATTAKLNEAARDGKFEFVVKKVECGTTTIGTNEYLKKNAQGQFCLMTVNVKNIGNEAQGFFGSNQKLLNAQNQQYAADDAAGVYVDQNYSTLFSNINPGNSVEGVIVFDIPKDQTPVTAQLHDSAFSDGVKVNLQ
jgi:septal ring-binding cell division protein DamX